MWYCFDIVSTKEVSIMKNGFSTGGVFTLALGLSEPWLVTDVRLLPGMWNTVCRA